MSGWMVDGSGWGARHTRRAVLASMGGLGLAGITGQLGSDLAVSTRASSIRRCSSADGPDKCDGDRRFVSVGWDASGLTVTPRH